MRKVGESAIIKKKVNVKKQLQEIGKKKDNDVDADVAQREHSNIKRHVSAFSNIQIYIIVVMLIL